MRRNCVGIVALAVALALAGGALAVDVQLKDGTVIHAASYKVQGSYVLVRLENGSQVAYDLGDVNLDAMKAAEEAAQPAPESPPAPPGNAFAGAMAGNRGKATLKITDQDVSHVETGGSGATQEPEKKPLADHQEGGQVVVQGVKVEPAGPGKWLATGQVVNRTSKPVMDVRVVVQAVGADSKVLGEAELPVAGSLDPGKSGKFSHGFEAVRQPLLRVRVFWMQREKTPAASKKGEGEGEGAASHGGYTTSPTLPGATARPAGANATPSAGSRPPGLQWGGAPAYKRGGSGPPPTPLPY